MASNPRSTFDTVRSKAPTAQYSSRDLAAHTKLKFRQPGQGGAISDKDALKEELRRAEEEHFNRLRKERGEAPIAVDDEEDETEEPETKRLRLTEEAAKVASLDKDDSDDDSEESDSDADDDEDDTAELLRELEKIKKERAEEKERLEKEDQESKDLQREKDIATGNPLLNLQQMNSSDFSIKRRWDDDVIFKNQARGVDDKPKKRFVNDLLRSDFHKKFLTKYVR